MMKEIAVLCNIPVLKCFGLPVWFQRLSSYQSVCLPAIYNDTWHWTWWKSSFLFIYFILNESRIDLHYKVSHTSSPSAVVRPGRYCPPEPILPSPADIIPSPAAIARPGLYCPSWPHLPPLRSLADLPHTQAALAGSHSHFLSPAANA